MTDEFAKVYADLERGIIPAAYINPYLPIPAFKKRDRARERLVEMISEITGRRRASGKKGEDFLQTLMDASYKNGTRLSDHEITGLLLAAMFAGHHTSSVTTAWTLLELLQHPAELDKVRDEIDTTYAGGKEIDYASLREIVATERAIKETLRLHPPLFMLLRGALEPFEYGGYTWPKGTWFVVAPAVAHRLPEVFPNPDKFDPDRFGPGREEDKQPFAFIAFGGGRHKCMGNAFAMLQLKTIVAILLQSYDLALLGDPILADFHGVVIGPKQPIRLRYRRRK
jgi:sterol 14-demethylase